MIEDCAGAVGVQWSPKLGLTRREWQKVKGVGPDSRVVGKMLTVWPMLSRNASQKIILNTQDRS